MSVSSREDGRAEAQLTDFSVILINRPDKNSLSSKTCFSLKHHNQGWAGRQGRKHCFSDGRLLSLRNQCHFIPQDLGLKTAAKATMSQWLSLYAVLVEHSLTNSPAHACRCRGCVAQKAQSLTYLLLALYRHNTPIPALQLSSLSTGSPENLKSIHARPCC